MGRELVPRGALPAATAPSTVGIAKSDAGKESWDNDVSVETTARARRRRRLESTRNPLVALAIALPVAALLAFAFGGWSQFAVQATSVAHQMGH